MAISRRCTVEQRKALFNCLKIMLLPANVKDLPFAFKVLSNISTQNICILYWTVLVWDKSIDDDHPIFS